MLAYFGSVAIVVALLLVVFFHTGSELAAVSTFAAVVVTAVFWGSQ